MNNRAFTLVELLGIIIIISAIFLVSFPNFLSLAKSNEEDKYNNMVNDLCLAGESYIYSNMGEFPELKNIGSFIEISIEQLILYGNVDKNIKNPKTDKNVKDDLLKYEVLEDYSLNCEYIEG